MTTNYSDYVFIYFYVYIDILHDETWIIIDYHL